MLLNLKKMPEKQNVALVSSSVFKNVLNLKHIPGKCFWD